MGDVFPIVAGHEIIGDVLAVGDGERKWKVGERVGGPWHGGNQHELLSVNPSKKNASLTN
jgi:D-arabinose 1-dehydrogenase-like Zn-dependent alcohol dehydrogenase